MVPRRGVRGKSTRILGNALIASIIVGLARLLGSMSVDKSFTSS
jgi:hypothetical protein